MHLDTENNPDTTSSTMRLKLILERQQKRVFSRDEVLEIGESLVYLYEILATDEPCLVMT